MSSEAIDGCVVARPGPDEYAPFYADYVARMPEGGIVDVLSAQVHELRALAQRVAPERELFAYAPGKWSLRQLFGHLVDAERVFGFRLYCFSRGDANPLPGFDENAYVERAPSQRVPLAEHLRELAHLREANLCVIRRLGPLEWLAKGTANGREVSVRALAWILGGHLRHHLAVVRERYGEALAAE